MSDKYPGNFITGPSSGYSVYFNGVNSYLTFTKNLELTTDFTIEFWLYPVAQPTAGFYFMGSVIGPYIATEALKMLVGQSGSWLINPALPMPSLNRWNHIALVRNSNVMRLYINGVSSSPYTTTQSFTGSQTFGIGAENTGASVINKEFFMTSLRVSTIPRYSGTSTTSANFGFPSLPLTADVNTKFLSCQTSTIIDQSASPATITVNGAAAVSNFYLPSNNPGQFNPALGAAAPGVWSIDEAAYYTQNRLWPIYDPSFAGTTLMLHGNGANNAQNNTFLDSSANNFTITRYGNTTQGTFSPFTQTGWSNYFDGTTDYLSVPSSANLAFGTGDFTVEAWVNWYNTAATSRGIFCSQGSGGFNLYWNGSSLYVSDRISNFIIYGFLPNYSQWYHIAVSRSSGTLRLFINGGIVATVTSNTTNFAAGIVNLGGDAGAGTSWYGYLSNIRAVKGTAVYTNNFTPPTSPLTAVTNTQLLTCQSNRFKDNSTNNFTLTVTDNVTVQTFSPFNPSIAYTPEVIGGSGYFDGNGDYLKTGTATPIATTQSTFTIEAWVYMTADPTSGSPAVPVVVGDFDPVTGAANWAFGPINTRALSFYWVDGGLRSAVGNTIISLNTWNYITISVAANVIKLFVNGVLQTLTGTTTLTNRTGSLNYIGFGQNNNTSNVFRGYSSNIRIVSGAALYSTDFTPPTAPLTRTAPSGTVQLLMDFTNAGILDSTAKNNAETLADAKISTTQSKFGGSSMFFDGTGDYLLFPSSRNFELPADFTIEFWMYPTSVSGEPAIFSIGDTDPNTSLIRISGTKLQFWIIGSTSGITTCNTVINVNTWYHVAWVRSGTATNNVKLYLNGVQDGVATKTAVIPVYPAVVARYGSTQDSGSFAGYIDDLRVTKNIARYLANFTPPTSQLQDQ